MDWLVPTLTSSLVGTLVLALVYFYLYSQYRQKCLIYWATGWAVLALHMVFQLIQAATSVQALFTIGEDIAFLACSGLMLWGTDAFLNRSASRGWWLAGGISLVAALAAILAGPDWALLALPLFAVVAALNVWNGWLFLRAPSLVVSGSRLIGWAFILWGLHFADYPFLRAVSWFAPGGYLIAAVLELWVAFGIFVVFSRRMMDERRLTEERYTNTLRTAMDGIWITDQQGRFLDINDAGCQMSGYSRQELLAMTISDIDVNETPELFLKHAERIRQAGSDRFETRHRRKDGTLIEVEVSVTQLPKAGGQRVSFIRDITQRKQAQQALRESESRFRSLVEASPVAIGISQNGLVEYINPAFAQTFGYQPEAVIGQPISIFFSGDSHQKTFEFNRRREQGEQVPEIYELTGLRKDGSQFPLLVNARVIERTNDLASIVFLTDLSSLRQAEKAVRLSEERFKAFFDYSPAGMFILDQDLRYLAINQALAEINGRPIEQHLGRTLREVLFEGASGLEGLFQQVFNNQQPLANIEGSLSSSKLNTDQMHYLASFFPLQGGEGGPPTVGGVVIDQTAHKTTEADLHQRVKELEAVSRISSVLRSGDTLSQLLPVIIEEILAVVQVQAGAILLYDASADRFDLVEARGWVDDIPEQFVSPQMSPFNSILHEGKPLLVTDLATATSFPAELKAFLPEGWGGIALPIRALNDSAGILVVSSPAPFQLSESQSRLLETLTEMVGFAVHRARLGERTDRNLQRLAALHEIDSVITSSLDLRLTLEVLLRHTVSQLGMDAAEILQLNAITQRLEPSAGRGFRSYRPGHRQVRPGEGLAGRAMIDRRLVEVHLEDGEEQQNIFDRVYREEGFRAGLALPLMSKGQVVGAIVVLSRVNHHVDGEWLDFFKTLAGQVALAIEDISLVEKLRRSNLEMAQSYTATIQGLAKVVELRKQEPEGHTEQLAEFALRLAAKLNIPQGEWLAIRHGVFLHDVGLMSIPDEILLKEGPLNAEEWQLIRRHPQFTYDLFSPIAYLRPALDIPYCHHEKWDGSGYPRGLKGEQIPMAARLFAVVETWDSLRLDRPFRKALPEQQALQQISALSGTFFDPRVVEAFLLTVAR